MCMATTNRKSDHNNHNRTYFGSSRLPYSMLCFHHIIVCYCETNLVMLLYFYGFYYHPRPIDLQRTFLFIDLLSTDDTSTRW